MLTILLWSCRIGIQNQTDTDCFCHSPNRPTRYFFSNRKKSLLFLYRVPMELFCVWLIIYFASDEHWQQLAATPLEHYFMCVCVCCVWCASVFVWVQNICPFNGQCVTKRRMTFDFAQRHELLKIIKEGDLPVKRLCIHRTLKNLSVMNLCLIEFVQWSCSSFSMTWEIFINILFHIKA